MPVARKKRDKKRMIEKNPFSFSEGSVIPAPEELVQNPQQKPKGDFDAKKPLNKKVVSNKNLHRTTKK